MKKLFSTNSKYNDIGLLIIRLGLGLSYIIIHGAPKITGGPERWANVGGALSSFGIDFYPVFWGLMAAIAEFFGGICLLLGFVFRPALFLMCITMIVAFGQNLSGGQAFSRAVYPLELFVVLFGMIYTGPGRISLDYKLFSRKYSDNF
jgi:putative oxidoreductase